MLGRQVGTSLLRLPRCALPSRSLPCRQQQQQHDLAVRTLAPSAQRFYAEAATRRPGRPKKAVGEPSRPVKRDVKRAAKSPKEDAATKKVKARKEVAEKKAAKPKRPAKVLSEEEKARKAQRAARKKEIQKDKLQKASVVELRKIALDPPKVPRNSAWDIFHKNGGLSEKLKGHTPEEINRLFTQRQREIAQEWKNITPAELEHYNHLSHTAKEEAEAARKAYIASYTAEEVDAANKARVRLRQLLKHKPFEVKKYARIEDERLPKRPITEFGHFLTNRHASGDFKNIRASEATKLIAQEWKVLSEEEKKKYQSLGRQERDRYEEEYTSVLGHTPPPSRVRSPQVPTGAPEVQQAAAAA